MVLGMDRNGPKFERWGLADSEWWPEDPAGFFDRDAPHGRVDVLDRRYADCRSPQPTTPTLGTKLAVSDPKGHARCRVVHRTSCRSARRPSLRRHHGRPDVEILDVTYAYAYAYAYDEAIQAGSDHGLVVATLALRAERTR